MISGSARLATGERQRFLNPCVDLGDVGSECLSFALGDALCDAHGRSSQTLGARKFVFDRTLNLLLDGHRDVPFQEFIFGAQDSAYAARIPLAGIAPEELTIDAPGFVTFGGDHVQPTPVSYTHLTLPTIYSV